MAGKHRQRSRLQTQIIGLALGFSVLIALGVIVVTTASSRRSMRRAAAQSVEYQLQIAANTLQQDISEIDTMADWSTVNTTVRNFVLYDSSSQTLVRSYETVANKYSSMHTSRYILRYLVTDCKTRILQLGTLTSMSRALNETTMAELPGLVEGDKAVSWSMLFRDPLVTLGSTTGIPVVRSITSGGAQVARVYILVSSALITDAVREYPLPEGCSLYWLMGGDTYNITGGAMTELTDDLSVDDCLATPPAALELLDSRTLVWAPEGGPLILGYPVGDSGMYIAQSLPPTLYEGPGQPIQVSILMIVIVLLVLGMLLGMLLRRMVAVPVHALQEQLAVIAGGNFAPNPAIEWDNELGDIGRGINSLSRNVTALMDRRIEDEKQKQDLEYRMLQNQINPHFLYNTLNSIKWMATIQHATGIAEMTTALSRLLKSVSKGNERLVPLQDEFALLNDYFTIQQYRYGGTITMDVSYIEDEALCRDCMIPRFTLQPLVENAIFHGIEPKGCAGSIDLTVTVDRPTGDVLIDLTDDGVGMTPEQAARALREPSAEEAAAKYRHVGMWNVHRRLQYIFGDAYGLSIRSEPGKGTTVTVRLPGKAPTQEKEKTE